MTQKNMERLLVISLVIHIARSSGAVSCNFNSMCTCNIASETHEVYDVSCIAVPFYNFPTTIPQAFVPHMEIQGTNIMSIDRLTFNNTQIKSLTFANNKLLNVAEKSFSSLSEVLTSLDLSYNKLDSIPFSALRDLKNLQWLNLYGNEIHSILGDWSSQRYTVANLFLGGNDINDIPSDLDHVSRSRGLRHFKSLIWLNLDSNRISKLCRHSLSTGLQTLSISHNFLDTFPDELLTEMSRLQWLYLRDNHIGTIPDYTLDTNVSLEKIDLSENLLRHLPRNPFNKTLLVRDLNLAFNNMRVLLSDSFHGLQCGRIILSHNEIETVDAKAFSGLNETLEYLDFDHNYLAHVPYALHHLTQLKYLYLSANVITKIPEHSLQSFSATLKGLSLSGNWLNNIPKDALINCTELSYLNIGYNEIYEINDDDFIWGLNLRTLLLQNNRLTHLKDRSFFTLRLLKELNLSFNPLRYMDSSVFEGLSDLESLEISFSLDWEEFPYDLLKPLNNLQWLTLDNNNFKTLPQLSLSNFSSLQYLNLEGNRIEQIPVNLFQSSVHKHLSDIRLSNNNLDVLFSHTFSSLPNVQVLNLLGNKIKKLETNSFHKLENLTTVILCDNVISEIATHAFTDLPNLKLLDLHLNDLNAFSFRSVANVSNLSPLILNVSKNHISTCDSDSKIVNVEVFDLAFNNLLRVPNCLENVSALRKLQLDSNRIEVLGRNNFMHQTSLEVLDLRLNNISVMHKHAFYGLQNLKVLYLMGNLLSSLHGSQFSSMPRLRILDLKHNNLNYLPKDVFSGTALEMLDLSYNSFSVVPTLSDVGNMLRRLDIGSNNIEHVDSTTFPDIPHLQHLDLSNNKLSILPDNVFTSLALLQKLDLSSNSLRANFKELFHYAQSLKELHLANTGIAFLPHLPLPNLIYLNVSFNNIQTISKLSVQELRRLRHLYLNENKLTAVPSHIWHHLPLLKTLDLSNNPLKEIVPESFSSLHNLQHLDINHLDHIQKFESRSIMHLRLLSSLSIETWPNLSNFKTHFCALLANLTRLKTLKLHIKETTFSDQLKCVSSNKLKQIEIFGENLKYVDKDAFSKFTRNPELLIRISGTQIEELPVGLFAIFNKVSHLTIDLRNNLLAYLSPDIFYSNATTWKNIGTTLISGGLLVSNNQWKCGCHLAWLGHWLRRWARESVQIHTAASSTVVHINQMLKEATCFNLRTAKSVPIVKLSAEDMSCHASALSHASVLQRTPFVFVVLFMVFVYSACSER